MKNFSSIERFKHDAGFATLVRVLEEEIESGRFTLTEINQAAQLADQKSMARASGNKRGATMNYTAIGALIDYVAGLV